MEEAANHGWASKIRKIIELKKLSQVELARSLGVSAATVSRWLSGKNEPTPQAYVSLGNLAAPPDDAYFWERAGVQLKHSAAAPVKRVLGSMEMAAGEVKGLSNQRVSGVADEAQTVVAIPVYRVCAYADEMPPHEHVSLARAEVEEIITAPLSWCPSPHNLISMHVCGESMFPTMQNDALIIVDLSADKREELNHQLVVASHRDLGFKVARLQQLRDCFILIPANSACLPIDVTDASKWKIVGKVLWWVSRDTTAQSMA